MTEPIVPEEGIDKMELWHLLVWCLTNRAKECELIPINYCFRDAARQNDKRPSYISFYAPDQWAQNLTKNEKLLDGFVAVRIPRECIGQHLVEESLGPGSAGGENSAAPNPNDIPKAEESVESTSLHLVS